MRFFSEAVSGLHKAYPTLLGRETEEGNEEGEKSGTENETEGSYDENEGVQGFHQKWNWVYWIDRVSETQRISWDDAFRKNVVEFLNTIAYIKDKADWEKSEYEKLTRRNRNGLG